MSIYQLALERADIVHAIFIIESREEIITLPDGRHAFPAGDGDQALGLGQQHPAFFAQYYGKSKKFPTSVSHTQPQAWVIAAATFIDIWLDALGLDRIVAAYNLGLNAVLIEKRDDPVYVARFHEAYALVQSGKHVCPLAA